MMFRLLDSRKCGCKFYRDIVTGTRRRDPCQWHQEPTRPSCGCKNQYRCPDHDFPTIEEVWAGVYAESPDQARSRIERAMVLAKQRGRRINAAFRECARRELRKVWCAGDGGLDGETPVRLDLVDRSKVPGWPTVRVPERVATPRRRTRGPLPGHPRRRGTPAGYLLQVFAGAFNDWARGGFDQWCDPDVAYDARPVDIEILLTRQRVPLYYPPQWTPIPMDE